MSSQQPGASFAGSQRESASARPPDATTTMQSEEQFWSSWAAEEEQVLRECFYALQGISGERIQFPSDDEPADKSNDGRVRIRSKVVTSRRPSSSQDPSTPTIILPPHYCQKSRLGSGASDAISILAEAGWLYKRIQTFLGRNSSSSIQRALANALQLELQSYRQFLSQLETRIDMLHLRHLLIETQAPIRRLKVLAAVTDGMADHITGPHLLHALHQATRHGDTRHRGLVQRLLSQASRPFFHLLALWTTEGILSDPGHEFFVTLQESATRDCHLWTEHYRLDHDKIPVGILDADLIELVFVIGKGINFIHKCLHDEEWSLDLGQSQPLSSGNDQDYKMLGFVYDPPTDTLYVSRKQSLPIRKTLQRAAKLVHSHILSSLFEKHTLIKHLFALKQFLLLGQGDLFSALVDGIQSQFEDQVGIAGIYRHTLTAVLETAVRSTNACQFPPEILGRLQVAMLLDADDDVRYQFGKPKGASEQDDQRTVWDIFLLEYMVPDALLSIVHAKAREQYKRMFLFLFGLRRVEFRLNLTWRQSAVLQRALQTTAQHYTWTTGTSPEYAQSIKLLRQISMTRQAMMHFVVNLKSYLMFEIIEGEWKELVGTMEEAETLDEAIQAHDDYLEGICRKSLLTHSWADLGSHVKTLLHLTGEFCQYQEHLFGVALQTAELAATKRKEAEIRAKRGEWEIVSEEERAEEMSFFGLADEQKMAELDQLSTDFSGKVVDLLRVLNAKLNGGPVYDDEPATPTTPSADTPNTNALYNVDRDDLDPLRFLAFQLNCNKFYSGQN